MVMIGKGRMAMGPSQICRLVSRGNVSETKPKPPMGFAPRACDPVRIGRGSTCKTRWFLVWSCGMVRHGKALVLGAPGSFGLVSPVGKAW